MRGTVLKRVILVALAVILTTGCATVQSNSTTTDKLNPGAELRRGDYLTSAGGGYRLILQRDGNLVLYDRRNRALWSSDTQGMPVEKCTMQGDGNLVLYLQDGQPVWASNTQGHPGAFLW